MKRILIAVGALALALGLAWQFGTSILAKPVPTSKKDPLTLQAPVPVTPPTYPDCGFVHGCPDPDCMPIPPCTDEDLGSSKCNLSGGGTFNCPGNQTVHARRCPCDCGGATRTLFCQ